MYDLIIIGGGPGGTAAGVYAGRKKLNTLLITESFGGQSLNSNDIENWIGTLKLTGFELAQMLEKNVQAQESVKIQSPERVERIEKKESAYFTKQIWEVSTNKDVYQTKALVVTSGGRRRKL